MDRETKKRIEHDCARFMRVPTALRIASELLSVAAPTVSALLIGDMADDLLVGDTAGILAQLPRFAASVAITALVVPLSELAMNLLLTKYLFAYEAFLADRYIRLPLLTAQRMESGEVMERFEDDADEYSFAQVFKRSRPPVLAIYLAVLIYIAIQRGLDPLFMGAIMLLSAMPVVWARLSAGTKARLNRQTHEYDDERKSFEHGVFASRDFIKSFHLRIWANGVFRRMFENYYAQTGKKSVRLEALSSTLDYAFRYGTQILVAVFGALLIAWGRITAGGLLGGVLLLPTAGKWFSYLSSLLCKLKQDVECRERIALFYVDEPETAFRDEESTDAIVLNKVRFRYPNADRDVFAPANFAFDAHAAYQVRGANGSGKTTLFNLLGGLYAPTGGSVEDKEGRSLSFGTLRNSVSMQEQNGAIFSGTVFDNLFADEARRADAESMLSRFGFNKPIDYTVAEGGANLSPGEQKKLLLVRALLRKAPLLVLDEPLNHLDRTGADALSDELKARRGGLILASHRSIDGVTVPGKNVYTLGVCLDPIKKEAGLGVG